MFQRKTQSPTYWSDEFTITSDDLHYLSTILVEEELPLSGQELGRALVLHHCRREEKLVENILTQGTPYQPKNSYTIDEQIVFPALDYDVGKVIDIRPGHNPEYGAFQVLEVEFEKDTTREFAAEFTADHRLNIESKVADDDSDIAPPEELAEQYGSQIGKLLEKRLESEADFVRLAGKWFLKDLLVDVNVGHLNLAEAVLDMADGGPLPTQDLLGDLELPEEITPQLRIFSLNYMLQEDERFDEVGPAGQVLWFLHRLEPPGVQTPPPALQHEPITYDPALLTSEMVALERRLDDEWSDLEPTEETDEPEPVTTILTYPHWKSGTLPISSKLSRVFPTGRTYRIRFVFVDGKTGAEMPGWVVRKGRYVYGLKEWYEEQNVPVGAYLKLERGEQPGTVVIQARTHRPRREWVRVALSRNAQLAFEMRKELIACEYDELMIVTEDDTAGMELVRERVEKLALGELTAEIFPELAKLSPQGTVHAATLYSAINTVRRTPPGPLLAELVTSGTYAPVGDNYWVLRLSPDEF